MRCLFLLVNSVCNIACTYCFYTIGYEKRSSSRIHSNEANYIAKCIRQVEFKTVILTGGDPLHMRFKQDTYKLIEELKKYNLKVIVNTSAAFLNDSDLDLIVSLGVDRVDISIDSHDPIIHNAQRGRHEDAHFAISGLLSRNFKSVTTTTVVTELNASTIHETIRWLQDFGVCDIRIQHAFDPSYENRSIDALNKFNIQDVGLIHKSSHVPSYSQLMEHSSQQEAQRIGAYCQMGKEYFVCDALGNLTPCFHRGDISLGNIFRDSVEEIQSLIHSHELAQRDVPPCFGRHCVSLFDNPRFWRNDNEKTL
ncbi:MAG: radical SAM protein [Sulfurimonas sp.]|jgi:MoaA/NifB/PqqE/SkfB family radical SAM enzyme